MITDSAIYFDGRRNTTTVSLDETLDACRALDGLAWFDLATPTDDELNAVRDEFSLPALALEDTARAHQRPKVERYDEQTFLVVRAARYVDSRVLIELDELHVFAGPRFVITVRPGTLPDLEPVHRRLEGDPALLRQGPTAVLYAILDLVVDDYAVALRRIGTDIDAIETTIFADGGDMTRRTYDLSREIIEFQRAITPVPDLVATLLRGAEHASADVELLRLLRDVHDHAIRVREQVGSYRDLLESIVAINLSMSASARTPRSGR